MTLHALRSIANPISTSFATLLRRASLTQRDTSLFESHRSSVTRAIETHLDTSKVELMGSFRRGSAIHGSSDIDLLAVLRVGSLRWGGSLKSSATVLAEVRRALLSRYPNSVVGRDGQAVVVSFNDGQHPVDVVPACYAEQGGPYNHPLYFIPDGTGGWMVTSPSSHNRFLAEADSRAGGQLKFTSQLLKYWRGTRATAVPMSAFHLELLIAQERLCEGARSYADVVRDALVVLSNRDGAALHDPVGISGLIPLASTESKCNQAMQSIDAAARHADAALLAERSGDFLEANRQWGIVFNGHFPS
ncbi:MAG: nucleotidyltransferase [Myxococcales bacterium]|nr:nucleotidyltransferase [Myxococcales bacterium]